MSREDAIKTIYRQFQLREILSDRQLLKEAGPCLVMVQENQHRLCPMPVK